MAHPVGFRGANYVYAAPKGLANCLDIEAYRDAHVVMTCWRFSQDELDEIAKTGIVWVRIPGHQLPPMAIIGTPMVDGLGKVIKAEPILTRADGPTRRTED